MNQAQRQYRYYDFLMAAYVCIVLCANLIGAAKKSTVHLPVFGEVTSWPECCSFRCRTCSATS